jgi:hypothetical protein
MVPTPEIARTDTVDPAPDPAEVAAPPQAAPSSAKTIPYAYIRGRAMTIDLLSIHVTLSLTRHGYYGQPITSDRPAPRDDIERIPQGLV